MILNVINDFKYDKNDWNSFFEKQGVLKKNLFPIQKLKLLIPMK